ncbi:ABC transporter permease [Deinococcus aquiradiocola]|uniref:Peptide ABC transporter permease n=1 Tax=Deinococcus aquiradiocola TaxID=393059 RepID=A0A917P7A8_9DEIO|nr:ABC transporter permease [Deinococcus aquiradiocola]GGJ64820.1 peptide ABC transporter permease [Deinococcus aquiradiocola]
MTATVQPARRAQQNVFWKRFRRSTPGKIGAVMVLVFVIAAVLAPILHPYDASRDLDYRYRLAPPSVSAVWDKDAAAKYTDPVSGKVDYGRHIFGTDNLGRDVAVRVWHGARVSLIIGIVATAIALVIGSVLGLLAGYFGGLLDSTLGYVTDVLLAFPSILIAIGIASISNLPGLYTVMLAVSIPQVPLYLRLTRSVVLSVREREFVQAAGALGAGNGRMLYRHVLPNSLSPLIVQGALSIATATIEAAALGFLGLGVPPPNPEWGTMLSDSREYYTSAAWTMIFPGLAILFTVLGFNLLGDGLRDVLDPRSTQ